MSFRLTRLTVVAILLMAGTVACSRAIKTSQPYPPTSIQMAQFWVDAPVESRDLLNGPGNVAEAPAFGATLEFLQDTSSGFSTKVDVVDASGREWNAKFGPEAQSEVLSSRLVWAMGYHQIPQYLVGRWILKGGERAGTMPATRFRHKNGSFKDVGDWSWHENPFVGTQPYRGQLVLMAMLNNSDLKPQQNHIYEMVGPGERPRQVYVVSDLGLSWGESGIDNPKRNDPEAFEKQGFIKAIEGNRVIIDQKNLRAELFDQITTEDLRWMAQRLSRLSDKQWNDAFRAAGYSNDVADRFLAKMKQKIQQGLRAQPDAAVSAEK